MFAQFSCRNYHLTSCLFLAAIAIPLFAMGEANPQSTSSVAAAQLFNLPMQFVKNAGQTDKRVEFLSRGPGYTLFLTPTQAVFSLSSTRAASAHHRHNVKQPEKRLVDRTDLQMNLVGANPHAVFEAV